MTARVGELVHSIDPLPLPDPFSPPPLPPPGPTHRRLIAHPVRRYPQRAFPYADLVATNAARSRHDPEYDITDTGVFSADAGYWDVQAEYHKNAPNDMLIVVTVTNQSPHAATLHLLPQAWFRNSWSWGRQGEDFLDEPPVMSEVRGGGDDGGMATVSCRHPVLGEFCFSAEPMRRGAGAATAKGSKEEGHSDGGGDEKGLPGRLLFTNNETNTTLLWGDAAGPPSTPYVKDAFHRYVVDGEEDAVNPDRTGTKCGILYVLRDVPPGESHIVRLRLVNPDADTDTAGKKSQSQDGCVDGNGTESDGGGNDGGGQDAAKGCGGDATSGSVHSGEESKASFFGAWFAKACADRKEEADSFFHARQLTRLPQELRLLQRQAYAGLMWSKQFFHYSIKQWLEGDPAQLTPPPQRWTGRNSQWTHMFNRDVISMPDKWEYPWFAAWDLAFHMVPFAVVDPHYAKFQLVLFMREWYMHPNGQLPAYEWALGDVNPPVCWDEWIQ